MDRLRVLFGLSAALKSFEIDALEATTVLLHLLHRLA